MKKIILLLSLMIIAVMHLHAQSLSTINYQGTMRHPDGTPLADREISLRLTILGPVANGKSLYCEIRKVTTNAMGMYQVAIGSEGAEKVGVNSISEVNWGDGDKFLRVEIDPNANNDFLLSATVQLSAVPFALYAQQGGTSGYNFWKSQQNNPNVTYADYFKYLRAELQSDPIQTITADYSITAEDAGKTIWVSGAKNIKITVSENLPAGFTCTILQKNTSNFLTEFEGVNSFSNAHVLAGQFAEASLVVPEMGMAVLKGQLK